MLWSTFEKNITNRNGTVSGHYVQTQAVYPSGKLHGPWLQRRPLVRGDVGHGMVFRTLPKPGKTAKRMLIAHRATAATAGARIWEVELARNGIRLGKRRKDLDGA